MISINLYGESKIDNKVIFELKQKIYTEIDLEERIRYLQITNAFDLNKLEKEEILKDYVSSLIFYEYGIENKIFYEDLSQQINNIYNNILKNSKISETDEIIIRNNLEIDFTRKKIIEDILNSKRKILNEKTNIMDLLYNYNVSYTIVRNEILEDLNFDLYKINSRSDFNEFIKYIEKKNINFIYKSSDILDSNKISNFIKVMISNDKKIAINKKTNFTEVISIEKNLESYEGIFVKLVNFKSNNTLETKNTNCEFINKEDEKILFKEYEYTKLNQEIKDNLKSINDYLYFINNNVYNYIFLCELRFDEEILNNINLNKKINFLADDIQKQFINKYKKIYNYKIR